MQQNAIPSSVDQIFFYKLTNFNASLTYNGLIDICSLVKDNVLYIAMYLYKLTYRSINKLFYMHVLCHVDWKIRKCVFQTCFWIFWLHFLYLILPLTLAIILVRLYKSYKRILHGIQWRNASNRFDFKITHWKI